MEKLQTLGGDNISSVGKKFLPVTGSVTALDTAAVAAIILLYQKCEWFRDAVWEQVKEFFVSTWEGICSFFTETIPAA